MNKLCSRWRTSVLLFLAVLSVLIGGVQPAHAGDSVPDWFRQLAHAQLPKYPEKADAVVLLDDETLTVRDNGEMYTNYRRVVKILRPSGKEYGIMAAHFDKETKLDSIHGWSISPTGQEYELKDKDAVETSPYNYALYEDRHIKFMKLPGVDVGAYVAFEYQQRWRPYAFSNRWDFQEDIPVKMARFSINLPPGWEYQYRFGNWTEKKPVNTGANNWTWEIDDIPGIEHEPSMPAIGSLAGRMAVSFYSASLPQSARVDTWSDVARWADSLNAPRRIATPKLQATVAELTQGKADPISKIRALANYAQHNIRYVEISIGIGGWQSHMAGDTFANSYGDCKDKATLLITMLREAGIDSYFTLVNDDRGVVNPAVPSPWAFNHAIVAIKLPADVDTTALFGAMDDPKLGKILLFDPTNDVVPLGMIPGYEQNSYALIVTGNGGELVKIPTLAPTLNRLLRVAHLELTPDGGLKGEVEEIRSGNEAMNIRRHLGEIDRDKRVQYFEEFLGEFLDRSRLTYASITGLEKYDEPLVLRYRFEAADYAKSAGDLMLVRPRVLGNKATTFAEEEKKRKYPVSYPATWLQSDVVDIKLPPGYKVDELPAPTEVSAPFAEYKSKVEAKDNVLYYSRSYTLKDLVVPADEIGMLQTFMRGIAADERNTAVLKKVQP